METSSPDFGVEGHNFQAAVVGMVYRLRCSATFRVNRLQRDRILSPLLVGLSGFNLNPARGLLRIRRLRHADGQDALVVPRVDFLVLYLERQP